MPCVFLTPKVHYFIVNNNKTGAFIENILIRTKEEFFTMNLPCGATFIFSPVVSKLVILVVNEFKTSTVFGFAEIPIFS